LIPGPPQHTCACGLHLVGPPRAARQFASLVAWAGHAATTSKRAGAGDRALRRLCLRLDPTDSGVITWEAFRRAGASWALTPSAHRRIGAWLHEVRVYIVFVLWLGAGVTWGVMKQGWDPITAGHFAVSALATGGLTAPPVDAAGAMPSADAIFVGTYCLFGIPLFTLMLAKLARVLVERHVIAAERRAIATRMRPDEFDLAKSLVTRDDGYVHLSDYLVLHLLRQGKISHDTVGLLRAQFDLLDVGGGGVLTLQQACADPALPGHGATFGSSGRCSWPDV